jgi:hypothetical protein
LQKPQGTPLAKVAHTGLSARASWALGLPANRSANHSLEVEEYVKNIGEGSSPNAGLIRLSSNTPEGLFKFCQKK